MINLKWDKEQLAARFVLGMALGVAIGAVTVGLGRWATTDKTAAIEVEVRSKWKVMSNDDIIKETKLCNDAGLDATAHEVTAELGSQTVLIQCSPRPLDKDK